MADDQSRSGVRYTNQEILSWAGALHAPHDGPLEAAFRAADGEGVPSIMLGPSEAKLLELLVRLTAPKRVLEIGTLVGYSGLRLARALSEDARLWTLELDPKHAEIARGHFRDAGVEERVEIVVGPAVDALPDLEEHGPFDLIFIDADKANYDVYGRWAAANLRVGGLLLGDNAYYFGELLADTEEAAAMRRFHQEAAENFDTACVPTADGLLVGVRRP